MKNRKKDNRMDKLSDKLLRLQMRRPEGEILRQKLDLFK